MAETVASPEITAMTFEDALAELETIVRRLEKGDGKLDEAIAVYERGALLKRHCEAKLREAQARVDKIVVDAQGGVRLEPTNLD